MEIEEKRKRKRERGMMIGLAVTFILLTAVEFKLTQLSAKLPFVNSIFFFGLINFNIIILVALLWLIFKNIGKLFFERRSEVLGSRLKTKLITAFIGFSTIPTITLFIISSLYIHQSFDKWFSIKIQNTLQSSLEISSHAYKSAELNSIHFSKRIAREIQETKNLSNPDLKKIILRSKEHYRLGSVAVYLSALSPPLTTSDQFVPVSYDRLRQGLQGQPSVFVQNIGAGDLVRSLMPIVHSPTSRVLALVVVDTLIPMNLTLRTGEITRVIEDYRDTNPLQYPIKTTYFVILVLITLMIVFSEIWIGLYLAREMTTPIERLVRATREVGQGRLDVQLEATGNDEIAVLVKNFNRMTVELNQQQNEIKQRTQQLEAILSNIATGVLLVSREGVLLRSNSAANDLLGQDLKNYIGVSIKTIFQNPEYEVVQRTLIAALKDLPKIEGNEASFSLRVKDQVKNLTIVATPVKDQDHQTLGAVAVIDDLTFIVKGQREMAWREVAKRMAHEIKNPLTPIKLSAQRLQRRLKDLTGKNGQLIQECTEIIVKHTDELKDLVNEFSNFARFPEVSPLPNQMNDLVQETVQLYITAHPELHFFLRLEPKLPIFEFDRDQIKRALINLIDNSVSALKTRDQKKSPPRIEIDTHFNPSLDKVAVVITDNGPGMDEATLDRAFEPYFSTKQEGTGLGLAIVKRIVSDHGGYVRLESALDRGTKFTLEFPTQGKRLRLV